MRRSRTSIIAICAVAMSAMAQAAGAYTYPWNTAECWPPFQNSWNVEASCTLPNYDTGYGINFCYRQVYGAYIALGNSVVTVPANCDLGMNLSSGKITFSAGKISIGTNSKITNVGGARFYRCYAYSQANGVTNCPNPMDDGTGGRGRVLYPDNSAIYPVTPNDGGTHLGYAVPANGTFCCGREGY